jgi:hypothetical protein
MFLSPREKLARRGVSQHHGQRWIHFQEQPVARGSENSHDRALHQRAVARFRSRELFFTALPLDGIRDLLRNECQNIPFPGAESCPRRIVLNCQNAKGLVSVLKRDSEPVIRG